MIIEMKRRDPDAPDGRLCIETIRKKLAEVSRLLLVPQPANVEMCVPLLEDASRAFGGLENAVPSVSRSDMHAVRSDLARVQALLAQAACLHSGWAQILGAAAGGYTQAGTASMLTATSRVSVQG